MTQQSEHFEGHEDIKGRAEFRRVQGEMTRASERWRSWGRCGCPVGTEAMADRVEKEQLEDGCKRSKPCGSRRAFKAGGSAGAKVHRWGHVLKMRVVDTERL